MNRFLLPTVIAGGMVAIVLLFATYAEGMPALIAAPAMEASSRNPTVKYRFPADAESEPDSHSHGLGPSDEA